MRNDIIVSNFNTVELFIYLGEQIRLGNKFENVNISDYLTDLFFKHSDLFDILRKNNIPKLQRKYYHKMMIFNFNKNQMLHQQLIMNNKQFNGKK